MIENKANKDLERKIDLYINGELDAEAADDLWAELIQDDYYLDYMKSAANVKAIVEQRRSEKPESDIYSIKRAMQYAAAAAVILITATLGVLNMDSSGNLTVSPLSDIGLEVIRNTEGVSESVTNEVVRKAIRLATDGQVEQAIGLLENELGETSDSQTKAEIALSLGSIQYNKGDYLASVNSFELVVQQQDVEALTLEKGYWLLGNTYFQLDRLEDAEQAFQRAYELNGAYSRVAKTYVDALGSVSE
ncbi:tetratricopeptide repeat protein [Gracilimonas mengyeensis]|uniref:Tetratricopeptide repeat-containing protein n=1 Tax=Gracilimonas mengyeensis TaxID=1302730 RepID=A0A521DQ34_9BACT|nr:tetratricopeptide repeat protein [Gracilimonas mengyeensis]SMO73837.1 Tetratricopeptide repeat-containing protein [Gracilimonas mengyeensis]